jgi:hypothetical protein
MTTLADRVSVIAQAEAHGYRLDIRPLPVPAGDWRPAIEAAHDAQRMRDLLARTSRAAGSSSPAVAATWHLEKHAWFIAAAALAGILTQEAVPPLDDAWVRDADEGWIEAIALPLDGWRPCDCPQLAEALVSHLEPLVAALSRHRSRRALWRCVGDRLGQVALWAADAFDARAIPIAAQALAAGTPMAAAGFEVVDGTVTRRRTGCCLSHRCADAITCDDCVLTNPAAGSDSSPWPPR